MVGPIGPGRGQFSGKIGAYEKSLEVAEKSHMGVPDRKIGPCPSSAARRTPITIIPHQGQFVNRQFTQK